MRYFIKNKIISLGSSSTVKDEYGNDLFFVKGLVFSFTRFNTVETLSGEPLYKVRNKFFHLFLPKVFLLDAEGKILLTIKKESFFSLRQKFAIIPAEDCDLRFSIEGDIIGRHYDILDNGVPVAHVRRNLDLFRDSFCMETDLEENAPLYIAFVIALDNYYDKLQEESR